MSLCAYTSVGYAFASDLMIFNAAISGGQLACTAGLFVITVLIAVYKIKNPPKCKQKRERLRKAVSTTGSVAS
jgi:hypothetical protein